MPHKPRYHTPPLPTEAIEELRPFLKDFEDIWRGPWAHSDKTAEAGHAYVEALSVPAERKSMEPLSARVEENRNRFYQLITRSPWEWLEMQKRLVDVGVKHRVFTKNGGLYLDDTALPKKGTHSVGVGRQFCGVLGKVDNCQVLPTLVWGAPAEPNRDSVVWPLGMELYLPEDWTKDAARRAEAGVPEEVAFRTKAQIGLAMLERVRTRVAHGFIGADAFYGRDSAFRKQLREWQEPFAVGVQPERLNCVLEDALQGPVRSASEWASTVKWRTITWSQGSKEPLKAKVARLRVRVTSDGELTEEKAWLLLEDREGEVKAWLCWGMDRASLKTLVARAHHRWVIEDAFGLMKGELGLDHFEGRKWNGVHHHASLVLVALAFLQRLRVRAKQNRRKPDRKDRGGPPALLPPVRGVVRAIMHIKCADLLEDLGIPRKKADVEAPRVLRMLGVNA